MENFDNFINELESFEFKIVKSDNNDERFLRFPKYISYNKKIDSSPDYDLFIEQLANKAFQNFNDLNRTTCIVRLNIMLKKNWNDETRLIEIFNDFQNLDYFRFIHEVFQMLNIRLDSNYLAVDMYGKITLNTFNDLFDAILSKRGAMCMVLKKIDPDFKGVEPYLKPIETPPPATEQRGFDLGLTEEQLKVLHRQLVNNDFLDPNTKQEHFINAFNGEVLDKGFERVEWLQSVFGATFLKVNFDTDSKKLKVWLNAEKIFNNGKAVSLRNAYSEHRHKDYFKKISDTMKSLQ